MQKRIGLIIIWVLAYILPLQLAAQELPFRHFTTDNEINPLPGSAVTAVFQDQTGYIWFAVYGTGLVRYDGHQMEVFTPLEGVSTYIFSIEQDNMGRLWVGGSEGISISEFPLEKYRPGEKISFTTQVDGLSLITSRLTSRDQLLVDRQGNIWTPSEQEIIRYHYGSDDELLADTISLASLPENQRTVYCFSEQRDGSIRGITHSQHMLFLSPDNLVFDTILFNLSSDIRGRAFTQNLLLDRSGTLWGSRTNGELWKLSPEDTTYQPSLTTMANGLAIRVMLETKAGQFLAGSIGGGLIEFTESLDAPLTYTLKNGMLSPVVWDLMQDREGNIWIATNSGLSRLPGDYKAFGHYTANSIEGAPNILPESGVMCMIAEMDWKVGEKPLLVAGTGDGLSFIRNGNARQILKIEDGLLDNTVLDVSQDQKGRVWITGRKGITCISSDPNLLRLPGFNAASKMLLFDQQMYITVMPFTHVNRAVITGLSRSEEDTSKVETVLFLGATSVLVFADEEFYYLPPALCLERRAFRSTALDGRGYLYVGDDAQGLIRSTFPLTIEKLASLRYWNSKNPRFKDIRQIDEPIFVPHPLHADTFSIGMVSSMYWFDSEMWMGCEQGIVVLRGDSLVSHTHITVKDGLKANGAVGFQYDPRSALLWASTNNGLVGIDPVTKQIRKTAEKKDGLVDDHAWGFPSVEISKDGKLYFGTAQGLSMYDPLLDETDSLAPVVVLRDFQLSENTSENNILEIEYASLSYTNEPGITYQTRLLGFDSDWTEDTRDTRIRYTNLPAIGVPKTYFFEVRAKDEFGNSIKAHLSVPFEIKPPWYLAWWVFAIYLFFLAVLIYTYGRWRTSALKTRQRELETEVTAATLEIRTQKEEVEAQRDEIEAQRDEIEIKRDMVIEQKQEITDSINYAQRIQSAVLPHKDYLDAIMPEYFVLFKPRDIVSGDFYWIKEIKNHLIIVAADCTGHGVPGAFMSMLGISFLNEQFAKSQFYEPGEILNRLRIKVKDTLAQEGKGQEQHDGIDMALAIIDNDTKELYFAGAYNPLYLIRGKKQLNGDQLGPFTSIYNRDYQLFELKGDRQPIGIYWEETDFTTITIQLKSGDSIYLFSDGIVDQKGGLSNKKFLSKNFKRSLLEIQTLSMEEQEKKLDDAFEHWMTGYDQMDDILVMGMRIN